MAVWDNWDMGPSDAEHHSQPGRSPRAVIPWHLRALTDSGLPSASQRSLPNSTDAECELCNLRPKQPLSTVLVIDGPDGLPVPFLICAQCRRALDELHALLESAGP
jgi:hypothetical protein